MDLKGLEVFPAGENFQFLLEKRRVVGYRDKGWNWTALEGGFSRIFFLGLGILKLGFFRGLFLSQSSGVPVLGLSSLIG